MNLTEAQQLRQLNEVLRDLAEELDVPPSKYEDAKQHYEAVGNWLGAPDSALAKYQPSIYPQGSFALGTAIRPLGDDDYDVDAVCLLDLTVNDVTQQQLKQMIGDRLAHPSSRYKQMLDPKEGGRRCWTIKYADGSKFHLDVLPAIPDGACAQANIPLEWARHAIRITDKETWLNNANWPCSNPKGYLAWFKERMRVQLLAAKQALAETIRADIEEIEDYRVRTPLQRLIQLLKRHRDERYNGDEDKPISVIITTLAAAAYNNEAELGEAILNVVPRMRGLIQQHDGVWWVPNPVNSEENFADKWTAHPRKAAIFFAWLDAVEKEHRALLAVTGNTRMAPYLAEAYGERAATAALAKQVSRRTDSNTRNEAPTILVPRRTAQSAVPLSTLAANPSKPWAE